jgi:hypothetical protein
VPATRLTGRSSRYESLQSALNKHLGPIGTESGAMEKGCCFLRALLTGSLDLELVAHEGSLQSSALWASSDFVRRRAGRGHPPGCSGLLFLSRRRGERPLRRERGRASCRCCYRPWLSIISSFRGKTISGFRRRRTRAADCACGRGCGRGRLKMRHARLMVLIFPILAVVCGFLAGILLLFGRFFSCANTVQGE